MEAKETEAVIRTVEVDCVLPEKAGPDRQKREVVLEAPLTIDVKDVGAYTIMCTPCDKTALAAGFLFSEGLIAKRDDISVLMHCPDDPGVMRVQLAPADCKPPAPRRLLIVSSCGICGSDDLESLLRALPKVGHTLSVTKAALAQMPWQLRDHQEIFRRTGGTHAVALFREGRMIALGEDLGRHSAFDKAVGKCMLQNISTTGAAAALSGRISLEIVAKAARAGIELIAAVSAPSTLAVEAAQRCHITLCGFVRGDEATVYCHSQRIAP